MKPLAPILCGMLLLAVSCVEPVDLDTKEDRIVVVNCILTQDAEQSLTLTWSSKSESEKPAPVTEADVRLFEGSSLVGTFAHQGAGQWTLPFAPTPGKTYTLRVAGNGFPELSATTTLPGETQIAIWQYPSDLYNEGYMYLRRGYYARALEVISEDAESLLWIYVLNQELKASPRKIASVIATDHSGVDLFNIYDFTMKWYVHDQDGRITGHEMMGHYPSERIDIRDDYPLHKYYLRIRHPRDYVRYLDFDGYRSKNRNGEWVTHYSNAQTQQDTSIRATANLFRIAGDFHQYFSDLVVLKVSEELDRYMLEGMDRAIKLDDADLTHIYNTENPYSNVKGGTGIFGAALRFYFEDIVSNGTYTPRTYEP